MPEVENAGCSAAYPRADCPTKIYKIQVGGFSRVHGRVVEGLATPRTLISVLSGTVDILFMYLPTHIDRGKKSPYGPLVLFRLSLLPPRLGLHFSPQVILPEHHEGEMAARLVADAYWMPAPAPGDEASSKGGRSGAAAGDSDSTASGRR